MHTDSPAPVANKDLRVLKAPPAHAVTKDLRVPKAPPAPPASKARPDRLAP